MTEAKMEQAHSVGIRYIGAKPKKNDNVAGTDTVWSGFGDVQEVPPAAAAKLLATKYANIWQRASDKVPDSRATVVAANVQNAVAAARAKAETRVAKPVNPDAFEKVDLDSIVDAISDLADANAKEAFGEDGQPVLKAVQDKLGKRISAAALKEAWDFIMSARA